MANRDARKVPPHTHGSADVDVFATADSFDIVATFGNRAPLNLDATAISGVLWVVRSHTSSQLQILQSTGGTIPLRIGNTAQSELLLVGVEPDGSTVVSDEVNITGNFVINGGALIFTETSAEPSDPAVGAGTIWLSDGTGFGDDGDICAKSNPSGTVKSNIIHDHSGGT